MPDIFDTVEAGQSTDIFDVVSEQESLRTEETIRPTTLKEKISLSPLGPLLGIGRGAEREVLKERGLGGPEVLLGGVPFSNIVPPVKPEEGVTTAALKTGARLVLSLPEFFTTPEGVAAAVIAPVMPAAVSTYFAATMVPEAIRQIDALGQNWSKMTPAQRTEALGNAEATALMGAGAATHAGGRLAGKFIPPKSEPIPIPPPAPISPAGVLPVPEKGPGYAVPVESADAVSVQPAPRGGEAMAERVRETPEGITRTETEAAQARAEVAAETAPPPSLPEGARTRVVPGTAPVPESGQPGVAAPEARPTESTPSLGGVKSDKTEGFTIYRAGDKTEVGVKPFSSWTENKSTAEAYLDNPGFGGKTLRQETVPSGRILNADTTSSRGMADLAEAIGFSREDGQGWWDNGWRYPWEESAKVKTALKNSGFDYLRYVDDFPEGAKSLLPLKKTKKGGVPDATQKGRQEVPVAPAIIEAWNKGDHAEAQRLADALPEVGQPWNYRTSDIGNLEGFGAGDPNFTRDLKVRGKPLWEWLNDQRRSEVAPSPAEQPSPAKAEMPPAKQTAFDKPLKHGSYRTDLTELKSTKTGDFGSGVYLTTDEKLARRFADSTAFGISAEERAARGSGKVYDVRFIKKPKNPWIADKTPLTEREKEWWNKTEDGLEEGIDTREDLADAKGGHNYGPWEATELTFTSKDWNDFAKEFGHDVLVVRNEIIVKDPKLVEIKSGKESQTVAPKPNSPAGWAEFYRRQLDDPNATTAQKAKAKRELKVLEAKEKTKPLNMAGQTRPERPAPVAPPEFGTLHPKAQAKFNAAWDARDTAAMKELLYPSNKGLRAEFERRVGKLLPKTLTGTRMAVESWGREATKSTATPTSAQSKGPATPETAPTPPPSTPKSAVAKVEAEVSDVAKTEGKREAKEVKTELVQRLEKALEEAPSTVDVEGPQKTITIDIPGDGTFTLANTKENIQYLLNKARRLSVSSEKYNPLTKTFESEDINSPRKSFEQKRLKAVSDLYGETPKAYEVAKSMGLRPPGKWRMAESHHAPATEGEGGTMQGPGSPSAEQPMDPTGSQLRQLTDAIKAQSISPKVPLGERIAEALRFADRWSKTKEKSVQAVARVRAASAAAVDAYLHDAPWGDFKRSLGKWIGTDQQTAIEVRRFQQTINRMVPNRLRQEAITNWIQADGDEALLRQRADASKPAVRRGYELALELNDAEKTLARNISSYFDSRLQEGLDAGLLKQGIDNYVTQIWKRPTSETAKLFADLFGTGTLNPSFKYARQRIFESYFDGEQAGFIPRDKRIGSLIASYDLAFNRALSARALIRELQAGKAADGMPITMTSGKTQPIPAGEEPPAAFLIKPNSLPKGAVTEDGRPYRPIDHWALRDWKWATKGPEGQNVFVQGDMLVHPDHWKHLNAVLKTSRLQQNPISRAVLMGQSFLKQGKLSLSLFHMVQEGVHSMAHRVNPLNPKEINLDIPEQKYLVDHGLMVYDPRAYEFFAEGMTGAGWVTKVPGLGHLQAAFNDMLFKDYIPRLKMTMALDALERNRKAYAKELAAGKISDEQIAALTARESNAAFGEQNYKMMGRDPTYQDIFRLALLAPDFLEARFRFVGQALKPYGQEQRVALLLMGATLYTASRILNKALDDDYHWDKPFSIVVNGKQYTLRTILGDVQHLATDPRSFWANRLSPIGRTSLEYLTSRDDRGIKRTTVEQIGDFAKWFVPIPLQTRSDLTALDSLMGSTGVGVRRYGKQQELYDILDRWRKNLTDVRLKDQYDRNRQETHADSPYTPLRHALRKGDITAAKDAYWKAIERGHRPAEIAQAFNPNRPFTGSQDAETKFLATLNAEEKQVYDLARKERQATSEIVNQIAAELAERAAQKLIELGVPTSRPRKLTGLQGLKPYRP